MGCLVSSRCLLNASDLADRSLAEPQHIAQRTIPVQICGRYRLTFDNGTTRNGTTAR